MTGVEAVGAYAPRLRIAADEFVEAWGQFHAAGVVEKAVPEADEDALTMAAEAASRALTAADRDPSEVAFLALATTTPPLEEEDLSPRLGEFLGVPSAAAHRVFGGSTRAGTQALRAAFERGTADGVGLVVAADAPRGEPNSAVEHAAGAGAAAFVVSADGPATLREAAEHAADYPGTRFRPRGEEAVAGLDITGYDRQAFTETLAGAAARLSDSPGEFDAVALQAPDGKLPYRAARALGVDADVVQEHATVRDLGDAGAASVPLSLARALAAGPGSVLALSFGSGAAADALAFDAPEAVPADLALDGERSLAYAEYLRRRGDLSGGEPSGGGAYVSIPSWRRTLAQRYRLVAGRCRDCGALDFPPEGACSACRSLGEFEDVTLPGTGTVEAVTVIEQGGAPPEFATQQAESGAFGVAIVALDGPADGTVSAPAQVTDAEPGTLDIGDRVEATVRRIYTQEDVTRYGFKVRPAVDS